MGNSTKTVKRVVGKPFEEGKTGNPNGRPKGQRNYATIYRAALLNIAKANDKTPEEIEEMLEVTGLKKALKGDFNFWKDVRDRIHGKPAQVLTGQEGGPIVLKIVSYERDNDSIQLDSGKTSAPRIRK